jgi:hypothetical protein
MILYYTHNKKPRGFMERCYKHHRDQAERVGQRFVAVVAEKFSEDDEVFDFNPKWPNYADIYLRILHGLIGAKDEAPCYLCEDDTIYPDERYGWALPCPRTVIYNLNLCYIGEGGFAWHNRNGIALSQLMGSVSAVRHNIEMKLESTIDGDMSCVEPCSGGERPFISATCMIGIPSVDFRTAYNATWSLPEDVQYFEDLLGWGSARDLWSKLYTGETK